MTRLRRPMHAFLIAVASVLFATAAEAATCNVAISTISPIPNVLYDPFEGVVRTTSFTLDFANAGPDACAVSLAAASSTPGSLRLFKNGLDSLRYSLEFQGGAVFTNSLTAPLGAISVPAGGTRRVTLIVKIDAGLIAPAATYADVLTFRAYRAGTTPLTQVGTDRTANAGAVIQARAQVNIAGSSGSFGTFALDRLDFGALTTGASKSAIVQVRATSPVSITVSSQGLGRLKHKTVPADPGVPYVLQLDNTAVGLGGGSFSLNRSPPITLDGINYPMSLSIGDVTGRPAGDYQDTLTINVAPL